jgi:hypothetical protein
MKLTFHVFLKDVHHLWREIAVALALVAAYGWSVPHQWTHPGLGTLATGASGLGAIFFDAEFWPRLLGVLIPIAWLFAIVRAIQSDSLVGDRQFWVTRPYDWKQLLAAKFLFVLGFVNLPLLMLDLYLLLKAGFAPVHYVAGLLWMQLLVTLILLLPATALATVTATIGQLLLALLVIFLYMVGTSFLSERIESSQFTSTDPLPAILLIVTPLAIIALQYARRCTLISRWLIVCLMATLVLITLFAPYRTMVHRQYPPFKTGEQSPIQLAISGNLGTWTSFLLPNPHEVGIVLPLDISRADPGSILIVKGAQVEVEGRNGLKWDDDWTSMNSVDLLPQDHNASVNVALPRDLYQQLRDDDVTVRVTLAFTYFKDANRRTFVVPSGTFALPEAGLCSATSADAPNTYSDRLNMIQCLAPLHRPASLFLNLKFSGSTCKLPPGAPSIPDGAFGTEWIHSSDSPAEFGISPVSQFALAPLTYHNVSISNPSALESSVLSVHGLCPGTPLTLSNPQKVRDAQITQQFDHVHLPDNGSSHYRQAQRQ